MYHSHFGDMEISGTKLKRFIPKGFELGSIVVVTHLGFGAFRRVYGLGLVQLRFHVTLRDAVTQ